MSVLFINKMTTRTCVIELKTENSKLFKLKARNPLILQKWYHSIQHVLDMDKNISRES